MDFTFHEQKVEAGAVLKGTGLVLFHAWTPPHPHYSPARVCGLQGQVDSWGKACGLVQSISGPDARRPGTAAGMRVIPA